MEPNTATILLLIPLILIEFGLRIFALIKCAKKNNFKYLNKPAWIIIILLFSMVGWAAFMILEDIND